MDPGPYADADADADHELGSLEASISLIRNGNVSALAPALRALVAMKTPWSSRWGKTRHDIAMRAGHPPSGRPPDSYAPNTRDTTPENISNLAVGRYRRAVT